MNVRRWLQNSFTNDQSVATILPKISWTFEKERKLMSKQIKLRPIKMDHILNFLSLFVSCTRLTVNAWHLKVEYLI